MPWHAPAKIKRGCHFCALTGMWVFQNVTLHRASNSAESQAKIRLAFHFVERNEIYVFTPKYEVYFLIFYWLYKTHASASALIHRHQAIYWIFTHKKLSSIYRDKPIVTYWALMKRHALLTIWAKLKLAIQFFSGRKVRPWRNPRKRVARGGKLWSPETLLYPNISN